MPPTRVKLTWPFANVPPLFSAIPANDPLVNKLVSLHAAAVPVQQSPITDNNIASAFDAWQSSIGMRNFPPTTNRDVHYYRICLSHFAPHLIPTNKAVGQVAWQLTPAEAIYVLDLVMGSGGIPPDVNSFRHGQQTANTSEAPTKSPVTEEYWQDVSHFYATATPVQKKTELADIFRQLGILFQATSPAANAEK